MRKRKLMVTTLGLLSVALVILSTLGTIRASISSAALTPTAYAYLPFVARSDSICPPTSTNQYKSGVAYQFDNDDPVRPAEDHADKNIELRGYTVTDPSARGFVDYGCDDDQVPPQLATLFDPPRVPALPAFYQVHDWIWAQSPAPGYRAEPITDYPVTALGLQSTPGETLHVPASGYSIGGNPPMEILILFADEDTVALRYTREDSSAPPGYTVHIDNICTDPNLLALYNRLDDPNGPRYVYEPPDERPYAYNLPNLPEGYPIGTASGTQVVVAIADSGAFQDPRSLDEWWQERPGYAGSLRHPSDRDYAKQWALEKVNAPGAWSLSTGRDIVIAVVDTGVDLDHPDLSPKVLVDRDWDFVNDDDSANDDHGHGTHVAGIAAAATDNEIGVAGMGWNATILPLKVLSPGADGSATGTARDIADAIRYAADQGADVINLSLGGEAPCKWPVDEAVEYAHSKGAVLVAASGNNGGATEMFPANCDHVLGVAATDYDDAIAYYSNYGTHVSVAAPGGGSGNDIYSTVTAGGYGYNIGTSMATPHVSGLAALLFARYPTYSPEQVASAILDNAVDLGDAGWDEHFGCGRIDAYRALSAGAPSPQPMCLEGATSSAQIERYSVPDAPFAPGEIIVEVRPSASAMSLPRAYAADAEFLPSLGAWRVPVPVGQERATVARLRADANVLHATVNYLVFAQD
jgi:hypothetical protein